MTLTELARVNPLKIDVVVHGRFFAFDQARELISLGHDVVVYTNYPKFVAKRFGLPPDRVKRFLRHGLMTRAVRGLDQLMPTPDLEPYFHKSFGRWAASRVRRNADLIYVFSGVAEEILRLSRGKHPCEKWVVRASAHIREQHRLLCEEEARIGQPIDKPSQWMIAREEREYSRADKIVVLSSFSLNSFTERGFGVDRLMLLPLGVESRRFRASAEAIAARCRRIASGRPLEVLTVGSFTARKGCLDLSIIAAALTPRVQFRFVGDLPKELQALRQSKSSCIRFHPRVPQHELSKVYDEADIFVFPTIEDGFAAVLTQAAAAGLPILTTSNCSGPDIVREGLTGWVFPIRRPDAFIERLQWCDGHRPELAAMVQHAHEAFEPRDWNELMAYLVQAFECHVQSQRPLR
jgi:glycosyltransferase involved in cell wall biosynthesis